MRTLVKLKETAATSNGPVLLYFYAVVTRILIRATTFLRSNSGRKKRVDVILSRSSDYHASKLNAAL